MRKVKGMANMVAAVSSVVIEQLEPRRLFAVVLPGEVTNLLWQGREVKVKAGE